MPTTGSVARALRGGEQKIAISVKEMTAMIEDTY
jgi:hypothetical protein